MLVMRNGLRKFLFNKFHDTKLYPEDQELRRDVELYHYLFNYAIELQKRILPKKIKYFFKHEPTFFLKLFLKLLLRLWWFIFGLAVFSVIVVAFLILVCHVKINLRTESIKKENRELIIYVPNTGVHEVDSLSMDFYKRHVPKAKFIWFYIYTKQKDWDAFKYRMHFEFETTGLPDSSAYKTRRIMNKQPSQFWGMFQLGESARHSIGDYSTWDQFSTNPERQNGDFLDWMKLLYKDMKPEIDKFEGKFIGGYHITASGILAMTHNVGEDGVRSFLYSNGKTIPTDGDGKNIPKTPGTRFLALGGYNLNLK